MWKIATRKAVWDKFARKWYHNLGKIEILIQVHTKVRVKQESISEGSWYQGPWQGYLPPPGKDMGPKIPTPLWTDPCLWKYYLPPSFLFYPRVFCEEWNLFTNKSRSLCEEHSTYTEIPLNYNICEPNYSLCNISSHGRWASVSVFPLQRLETFTHDIKPARNPRQHCT